MLYKISCGVTQLLGSGVTSVREEGPTAHVTVDVVSLYRAVSIASNYERRCVTTYSSSFVDKESSANIYELIANNIPWLCSTHFVFWQVSLSLRMRAVIHSVSFIFCNCYNCSPLPRQAHGLTHPYIGEFSQPCSWSNLIKARCRTRPVRLEEMAQSCRLADAPRVLFDGPENQTQWFQGSGWHPNPHETWGTVGLWMSQDVTMQ